MTRRDATPGRNPLLRTQVPLLPPATRSQAGHMLTAAAALGRFMLQVCQHCGTVQYPARDVCVACLSDALCLTDVPPDGRIIARTTTHAANEGYFRERLPWAIGSVQMQCGPTVIANIHAACAPYGRVRLRLAIDRAGGPVLFADPVPETGEGPSLAKDARTGEFGVDPAGLRVLVTDGRSACGQAAVRALHAAGAACIYVGDADPVRPIPSLDRLVAETGAERVTLDLTDEEGVMLLAGTHAHKIDILVNTADLIRPGSYLGGASFQQIRAMDETVHLGLVRLARAFGPAMMARGADAPRSAAAVVAVLSAFALLPSGRFAAYSAAHAAALSVCRSLRSELRPGGIRVAVVFCGPSDTEWFQELPPPKVTPEAVGAGILRALTGGLEELAVGDFARDLLERIALNPKAAEREADQTWT